MSIELMTMNLKWVFNATLPSSIHSSTLLGDSFFLFLGLLFLLLFFLLVKLRCDLYSVKCTDHKFDDFDKVHPHVTYTPIRIQTTSTTQEVPWGPAHWILRHHPQRQPPFWFLSWEMISHLLSPAPLPFHHSWWSCFLLQGANGSSKKRRLTGCPVTSPCC